MRHYLQHTSVLAGWSWRLAVFAIMVVLAGVLIVRIGITTPLQGLIIIGTGLALASIALLLALVAYVDIWRTGALGLSRANGGLFLAVLLLAWPVWLIATSYRLPAIHDISTDLSELPNFSQAPAAVEARRMQTPPVSTPDIRQLQSASYPEIVPIVLELSPDEAYQLALQAAQQLHWRIVERAPPAPKTGVAHIDAVDRTPLLRFQDDITIRIRPIANQTRVDIRSVSRAGKHDLGTNAARIRSFSDLLLDLHKGA